ncbi:hypothetical protein NL453_27735, partial [Klebsiella pneumoniae]|nr:hypothetical protein [Klebsiella pneumoniae]
KEQSRSDKRAFTISLTEKAKSEQAAVEQAVLDKLISCDFMGVNAITLMKNLKELNASFKNMNL